MTRGKERKQQREAEGLVPPAGVTPQPVPEGAMPPPPDAPGPQGGLLDFFDGLKKKPVSGGSPPPPAAGAEPRPQASPPAATVKLEAPPAPIKRPKKPPVKEKPKAVEKPSPPRPRAVRNDDRPGWRPLLFKLLIGAGIATTAVAMQDKYPHLGRTTNTGSSTASPSPLLGEIKGHKGAANAVAYADDGKWIVTVGADSTLKVWDAGTSSLIRGVALDFGPATSLAILGKRAITGQTWRRAGSGVPRLWACPWCPTCR